MIRLPHVLLVFRRELALERRAHEVFGILVPFVLAALATVPVALGVDQATISRVGYPVFWAMSVLFGMQVAWRQTSGRVQSVNDQIRLSPLDPAAGFLGRFLANLVLLLILMAATMLGTILLFSPPPGSPLVLASAVILFAVGLALTSTLVADLTAGSEARGGLAALLVAPLALPLILAAAQMGHAATASETRPGGILPWVLILVVIDLIGIITGVLTASALEETLG